VVNALIILGLGFVGFGVTDPETGHAGRARHSSSDDDLPLFPTLFREREGEEFSALYEFASALLSHLTGSVLFAHGVAKKYGTDLRHETPVDDTWNMLPRLEAARDLPDAAAFEAESTRD
jgi:hypothetical protein